MEKIYKCPKCGEKENLHFNYDYNQQHRPIKDVLCNDCGEVFEGNMPVDIFIAKAVSEYPELEGTMKLCEDVIQKRTGKMNEEEWQAAERAQTGTKQENCCTPIGQIKRYVDCIGCDKKPKQETLEEVADIERIAMDKLKNEWEHLYTFGYPQRPFPTNYENDLNTIKIGLYEGAKWQEERMYSEEEVIRILDKREDYLGTEPSIFDYLTNKKWFEQFKKPKNEIND